MPAFPLITRPSTTAIRFEPTFLKVPLDIRIRLAQLPLRTNFVVVDGPACVFWPLGPYVEPQRIIAQTVVVRLLCEGPRLLPRIPPLKPVTHSYLDFKSVNSAAIALLLISYLHLERPEALAHTLD